MGCYHRGTRSPWYSFVREAHTLIFCRAWYVYLVLTNDPPNLRRAPQMHRSWASLSCRRQVNHPGSAQLIRFTFFGDDSHGFANHSSIILRWHSHMCVIYGFLMWFVFKNSHFDVICTPCLSVNHIKMWVFEYKSHKKPMNHIVCECQRNMI